MPRRLILEHKRAPGDSVVLTALIRDVALSCPGQFQIDVAASAPDVFKYNPYLTPLPHTRHRKDVEFLHIDYGHGINHDQKRETVHFVSYFHRDFEKKTGVKVPLTLPYPDLHLSPEEKDTSLVAGRYWVVISGGKSDFPIKVWDWKKLQQTVDALRGCGLRFVQVGSTDPGHWHPPLNNVLSLIGRTNLRDLFRLIQHADGVICGVTMAMHVAAALSRPCVVIAGGREAWWWEGYVRENTGLGGKDVAAKLTMPHRYLHTIGMLDCCKYYGCWKNKVVKIDRDKSLCHKPVRREHQALPLCMDMITTEHVVEAVMSYYTDKSLPPIGEPKMPGMSIVVSPDGHAKPQPRRPLLDLFGNGMPATPIVVEQAPVVVPTVPELQVMPAGRPGAPRTAATSPAQQPVQQATNLDDSHLFDNPHIGGKYTVCALFYGARQFHELHRRCLDSIIATVPRDRMDFRVGSNELCAETLNYIDQLQRDKLITKHYRHAKNEYKYPVMREMFWDESHPITTNWLLWFDDDSICDRNPKWLQLLTKCILDNPKCHMFGDRWIWSLLPGQAEWYRSRPWHRGRPFRTKDGRAAANGSKILFATGGFWALSTAAMRDCHIPDTDLAHNGGDYTIGEQLWQGGYEMKAWNGGKKFVNTSSVKRRGTTTPHFGTPQFQIANRR